MGLINKEKFNVQLNHRLNLRTSVLEKLNVQNSYACPGILRAKLMIDLKGLENFDSSRLLAAIFILTLLSGSKPYVLRFNLFQTFHDKDYDAQVIVNLNKGKTKKLTELLALNIMPFLSKADLSYYALKQEHGVLVNFTIADLSFIRVVETHSIFFKWHDKVNIQLIVNADEVESAKLLLSAFRINY